MNLEIYLIYRNISAILKRQWNKNFLAKAVFKKKKDYEHEKISIKR